MGKPKYGHGSITFGQMTLIFGGREDDIENVEIWDLERKRKTLSFNASHSELNRGFGMFLVHKSFCKQT